MAEAGVDEEFAVELRVVHPKLVLEVVGIRVAKLVGGQPGSVNLYRKQCHFA